MRGDGLPDGCGDRVRDTLRDTLRDRLRDTLRDTPWDTLRGKASGLPKAPWPCAGYALAMRRELKGN